MTAVGAETAIYSNEIDFSWLSPQRNEWKLWKNGDRVSKSDKICLICIMRLKGVLVRYEKYGTLSMYIYILQIS